jgi:uncharacterized integral membrane protein
MLVRYAEGERSMNDTLDYATPASPKPAFSKLTWAALVSVVEHLLVFGLYAPTLDGGRLARMCAAVSVGFWLVVLLIVLRHRRNPSKFDLAFVAFGYPVILFPCIYAVIGSL